MANAVKNNLSTYRDNNGRLVERYTDENGRTVRDTHAYNDGGPLMTREYPTSSGNEIIEFDYDSLTTKEGEEKPQRRCIYKNPNKLILDQMLGGSLDDVDYEEEFQYDREYSDFNPAVTIHRFFSDKDLNWEEETNHQTGTVTQTDYVSGKKVWVDVTKKDGTKIHTYYQPDGEKKYSERISFPDGKTENRNYDSDGKTVRQFSLQQSGEYIQEIRYAEDGKTVTWCWDKDKNGVERTVSYRDDGTTLAHEKEVDKNGRGFEKWYRDDGKTLTWEKRSISEDRFQKWYYEDDGKTVSYYENTTPERRTRKYYEKGKLARQIESYRTEDGLTRTDTYNGKGKLTGYTLFKSDDDGKHEELERYNAKGDLIEIVTTKRNGKNTTVETRDSKGKLIYKSVDVDRDGRIIHMESTRGKLKRMLGTLFGEKGDKGGDVVYDTGTIDPSRSEVNASLREILKDKSLSSTEKRSKVRRTVAEYREKTHSKALSEKVDKALKRYSSEKKDR